MQTRRTRLEALVFAVVTPFLTAAALLPGEFTHYKRWLELGVEENALRVAVFSAVAAKTLVVLLLGAGLLVLAARFVSARKLRALSVGWSALFLGFLAVDLELQRNTGNHLYAYLPFLFDSDTFVWAGEGFDAGPGLLRVTRRVLFALVPAALVAWLLEHQIGCGPTSPRRVRGLLLGVGLSSSVVLLAAPLMQRCVQAPATLFHLNERMPWAWAASFATTANGLSTAQARAQAVYSRALPNLIARPVPPPLPTTTPLRTPDLLMIVVESLRHDALDPATMPVLWEWSGRGLRGTQHYATSNASHYGLFALLYGQSPLRYFETLEAKVPPTLSTWLREWGYTNHYVTCTDLDWRGMGQFLGPDHFAVERVQDARLEECDAKVISRATSLFSKDADSPRFVVLFLMSTHFGYHYPSDFEPFQPAAAPPNAIELDRALDRQELVNRYRNSAHFIDSLIGEMLTALPHPDETLIVVTGDHGESLFDDGTIAHSSLLSEIQTRVPLVITGPGIPQQTLSQGPSDHTSLLPTLVARLGVERSALGVLAGHDLLDEKGAEFVPLVHAKSRRGGRDRIALISGSTGETSLDAEPGSSEARYSMRLDAEQGKLEFLGLLTRRGRPASRAVTPGEGVTAVRWLEHSLESITTPRATEQPYESSSSLLELSP